MAVEPQFTRRYLLTYESVRVMLSEQFREDVSTVPGMFAVLLVVSATAVVVIEPAYALIRVLMTLIIGLWIIYLLHRLVVAVETVADQQ